MHTTESLPDAWTRALFLAGPSPRTASPRPSWRPRALDVLRRLGFDGVVLVPEPPEGEDWADDSAASTRWELEGLRLADVIAFWIPRDYTHMPGFTTNVEFGAWIGSHKVVLGHPPGAPGTAYLDTLARGVSQSPSMSLEATLAAAMDRLSRGARRAGGEREVPLHVWRMPEFQAWYAELRGRGRLVGASLAWVRRDASGVRTAVLDVRVTWAGEGDPAVGTVVFHRGEPAPIWLEALRAPLR